MGDFVQIIEAKVTAKEERSWCRTREGLFRVGT